LYDGTEQRRQRRCISTRALLPLLYVVVHLSWLHSINSERIYGGNGEEKGITKRRARERTQPTYKNAPTKSNKASTRERESRRD
jgi:hypothetical protein